MKELGQKLTEEKQMRKQGVPGLGPSFSTGKSSVDGSSSRPHFSDGETEALTEP